MSMDKIVKTMWDFPLPYAPIKTRARSVDDAAVLRSTSSKSASEDLVGIKLFNLSSLFRSYPILTEY